MDRAVWGTVILCLGIALVVVQIVFSWMAAKRAREADDIAKSGNEAGFDVAEAFAGILKELAKTLPFGVAGILLIILGAAIGGLFDFSALSASPAESAGGARLTP